MSWCMVEAKGMTHGCLFQSLARLLVWLWVLFFLLLDLCRGWGGGQFWLRNDWWASGFFNSYHGVVVGMVGKAAVVVLDDDSVMERTFRDGSFFWSE